MRFFSLLVEMFFSPSSRKSRDDTHNDLKPLIHLVFWPWPGAILLLRDLLDADETSPFDVCDVE